MKRALNILILLAITMLFACQTETTNKEKIAISLSEQLEIPVKTVKISETEINRTLDYTANLVAFEENYFAPAAPGRIDKINVEIGDKVKKGEILVVMDQTQLFQAKIQFQSLELDYHRFDTLYKTESIAKQQYDQFMAQYNIAKSNVAYLEENTTLVAPFDGTVTAKYFENGELYSGAPNTPVGKAAVLVLMQINPIKAVVNISEQFYPKVKEGLPVVITSPIYKERSFTGKVYRIHPTINQTSRTFTTEITVANRDEILRPGMYSEVSITLNHEKAITVPAITILKVKGANERYIFVEKNGIAQRIAITLGKRFDDQVEIISDEINIGDNIIVVGQSRLIDGTIVKVIN